MNVREEDRAIGKKNYYAVSGSELTRREFLAGSLAAAAVSGGGLGAFYFGYSKLTEPVRVGIIGTGDEGGVLIGAHTPDYVQIVALADIRPYSVHRAFHGDKSSPGAYAARPGLMQKYGWKSEDEARQHVKVYDQDYHELLQDPQIEGVIIALPLHLHDKVAIEAMMAGKHVLTEKLMAHSVHQAKQMGRVAEKNRKHLATGHQRHYSILYDNAVDTIKRKLIGDLHHIRAQWHRGNLPGRDSWAPLLPDGAKKEAEKLAKQLEDPKTSAAKKEELMLKLAILREQVKDEVVDAAKHGYVEKKLTGGYVCSPLEELLRWRLWNRTGGGLMAELGSHQLDASGIFVSALREDGKKVMPLSVTGIGGRHIFPADREVDDHVYCMYEYPSPQYETDPNKKIVVTYSSINGNRFGEYGEIVMGTTGTLILQNEQDVMLFPASGAATSVSVTKGKDGPVLDTSPSQAGPAAGVSIGEQALSGTISKGYTEEIEHWAWCIRNFDFEVNKPRCHPRVALADAVIALTTNIAISSKQRIDFKQEWFDIDSDETPEGVKPQTLV